MSIEVMVRQMTAGFGQTCLIFFLTLIFSLPLGMIVYFGRVCRFKPLSWLVKIYISIMRGTPLMLQLLIWYFGPFYLWGMNIGGYKFTAIILGCSLNYAAYFAEIYRSGIESIPTGQYEAAQLLGYTSGYDRISDCQHYHQECRQHHSVRCQQSFCLILHICSFGSDSSSEFRSRYPIFR